MSFLDDDIAQSLARLEAIGEGIRTTPKDDSGNLAAATSRATPPETSTASSSLSTANALPATSAYGNLDPSTSQTGISDSGIEPPSAASLLSSSGAMSPPNFAAKRPGIEDKFNFMPKRRFEDRRGGRGGRGGPPRRGRGFNVDNIRPPGGANSAGGGGGDSFFDNVMNSETPRTQFSRPSDLSESDQSFRPPQGGRDRMRGRGWGFRSGDEREARDEPRDRSNPSFAPPASSSSRPPPERDDPDQSCPICKCKFFTSLAAHEASAMHLGSLKAIEDRAKRDKATKFSAIVEMLADNQRISLDHLSAMKDFIISDENEAEIAQAVISILCDELYSHRLRIMPESVREALRIQGFFKE